MKNLSLVIITSLFLLSCSSGEKKVDSSKKINSVVEAPVEELFVNDIDLEQIKKSGVLKALTVYSPSNYFLYKGSTMGFEYELLKNFSEYIGVNLQIVRVTNLDNIIPMLKRGEGDIIAHGFTVTEDRKKEVTFTDYHRLIHQVLVQRKPSNWRKLTLDNIDKALAKNVIDILNDTISVRKNSSYLERISNIMNETGGVIYVDTIPGTYSTDAIIEMVANGDVNYTIADNNIANINKSYFSILDVSTEVSLSQRVSWSVRKDSPDLKDEVNSWLKSIKRNGYFNIVYNKYYKNTRQYKKRMRSDYFSLNTGRISEYDELVKEYSTHIGWDWRLISSQIYQESKFNHSAESWVGAGGLMQLMPETAECLGMKNNSPRENVKAGTKYIVKMYDQWESIPDSIQRIKFALASYNCGFAHVLDAQRLTEYELGDPKVWDDNVEKSILKLAHENYYNRDMIKYGYVRGREPYNYVRDIFERYDNYKEFVKK